MNLRELNLKLTKQSLREQIPRDILIIQTIHTIDELTKIINKITAAEAINWFKRERKDAGKKSKTIICAGKKYLYQPGVFKYHKNAKIIKVKKTKVIGGISFLFLSKIKNETKTASARTVK